MKMVKQLLISSVIVLSGILSQNLNAKVVFLTLPESNNLLQSSSITGFVFSGSRTPVPEVYVELLGELNSTISRTKTNGAGFYSFRGLREGRYIVKVLTYGTTYEEQSRSVSLIGISAVPGRGGGANEQADFYLQTRKLANVGPLAAPGVIFVQEIPENAKDLYEEGVTLLQNGKEKEGFEKLKQALEIFPTYFLALDRLGTEYVVRGYYRPAYVLLTKALEINSRSFSSKFGLGLAQFQLKEVEKSIDTLKQAIAIYDESVSAYMWLGVALHEDKKLTEAQTALLQANKLSKGKSAEVHWQLARLYSGQNRYSEAADELELFLKYKPDAPEAEKVKETVKTLRQKSTSQKLTSLK